MNASRPEAKHEYSTSVGVASPPDNPPRQASVRFAWVAPGLGIGGALALLIAQFTPLLRITTVARHPVLARTVQTGPHHGWALVPVAVLALGFAGLARRTGSRAALVDLPGVHSTGIVGTPAGGLRTAQAHAAIGLYLETLAAALMLIAAAVGALLSTGARASPGRT
jgi:hypothetical protein